METSDRIGDKVEESELLRLYGGLLPKKQLEFLDLYYNEDLSLAEIGAAAGVSRQAVHDAVRQGRARLAHYERILGLYRRQTETLRPLLEQLKTLTARDVIADTTPLREVVKRIEETLDV